MKINELSLVTEISVGDFGREVMSHAAAVPSAISGNLGVQGSRERAEQSIAKGKFVNTFTSKFLSDLNNKVPQLKKTMIAAQQSLPPTQVQTLITDYLYNKITTYMTGYVLTEVESKLYEFCESVQNEYMANRTPTGILRQIGELLFQVATIQKARQSYASQPKPNQEKEPEQLDSLAQEAINTIKNLGSRNNTYQVAAAALTQLGKINPAAYAKLVASLK